MGAAAGIDEELLWLFYDPQTSGGLLIAAAPEHAAGVDRALMRAGVAAVNIGTAAGAPTVEPSDPTLELTPERQRD